MMGMKIFRPVPMPITCPCLPSLRKGNKGRDLGIDGYKQSESNNVGLPDYNPAIAVF